MQERLLKKPPFRFLHDVFMAVRKETGFGEGLYDEEELDSKNVKDKDSKLKFLTKMLTFLGVFWGEGIDCKPTKVSCSPRRPISRAPLVRHLTCTFDHQPGCSWVGAGKYQFHVAGVCPWRYEWPQF